MSTDADAKGPEYRVAQSRALMESYVEAWKQVDRPALIEHLADDFVLHYFGSNPFTGSHVGKAAAMQTMAKVAGITPRKLIAFEALLFGENAGVIVVREELEAPGGPHEVRRVFRYRIEGEKFAECWLYEESQQLINELWSS